MLVGYVIYFINKYSFFHQSLIETTLPAVLPTLDILEKSWFDENFTPRNYNKLKWKNSANYWNCNFPNWSWNKKYLVGHTDKFAWVCRICLIFCCMNLIYTMHLRLLKGPVLVKYRSYSTLQFNDCYLLSISIEYFPIVCFKATAKNPFKNSIFTHF